MPRTVSASSRCALGLYRSGLGRVLPSTGAEYAGALGTEIDRRPVGQHTSSKLPCQSGSAMQVLFSDGLHVHYGQVYVQSGVEPPEAGLRDAFAGQVNGFCGAATPGWLFMVTGLHAGHVGLSSSSTLRRLRRPAPGVAPLLGEDVQLQAVVATTEDPARQMWSTAAALPTLFAAVGRTRCGHYLRRRVPAAAP